MIWLTFRRFEDDAGARGDSAETERIAVDATDDVDRAGRSNFATPTSRGGTEKDAERVAWGPVGDVANIDDLLTVLLRAMHGNTEVDLIAPGARLRFDRERLPNCVGCRRVVQRCDRGYITGPNTKLAFHALSFPPYRKTAYSSMGSIR